MLAIRPEQMKVFEDVAMRRFEDEMVEHVKSNAIRARLCKVLGDEQLRVAIRQTITRAGKFGFTNRGPIRLYIELAFLFGSDFDTDPQYPAIGKIDANARLLLAAFAKGANRRELRLCVSCPRDS